MSAIRADYFGSAAFGTITGISSMVVMFGMVGGPLIAGILADRTGSYEMGFRSSPGSRRSARSSSCSPAAPPRLAAPSRDRARRPTLTRSASADNRRRFGFRSLTLGFAPKTFRERRGGSS